MVKRQSDYQRQTVALEHEIDRLRLLRDAQSENGEHRFHFQERIDGLTTMLRQLEVSIPKIEEMDAMVREAQRRVESAEQVANGESDGLPLAAGVSGGLCALIVLICLMRESPGVVLPTMAGGAFLFSVWAMFRSTRIRREAWEEVTRERDVLDALMAEREGLIPK
jgi:hypothetical protein